MARRANPPPEPQRAKLTVDQLRRGIARLQKRIDDVEEFDPQSVQKRFAPEVTVLGKAIEETLAAVFGPGTVEYRRYRDAKDLDAGPLFLGDLEPLYEVQQYLTDGKQRSLLLLRQAIRGLEEEIADQEQSAATAPATAGVLQRDLSKVFVVHGHDAGVREAVARFLERIELQAIILQEQADQGLTIIEKFESYASQVGFAVVLLTPDDLGGPTSAPAQASRARQNVIFELGYFAGKLGRGHACLLRKGDVEIPSDLYGVIYTDMDASDGWKLKLARELKAAGLKFDGDKVFG